jgi:hypothetical protein
MGYVRRLILAVAMLLVASWTPVTHAANAQDTPEATTVAFYTWFIKHDSDQTYPLREPTIARYVAKDTLRRVKNDYEHGGPPNGVDYFLKVQDYDEQDWLTHIDAHAAITLGNVAVVPVTFGSKDKVSVLVFLKKQEGVWKIIKIDDTWDYQ